MAVHFPRAFTRELIGESTSWDLHVDEELWGEVEAQIQGRLRIQISSLTPNHRTHATSIDAEVHTFMISTNNINILQTPTATSFRALFDRRPTPTGHWIGSRRRKVRLIDVGPNTSTIPKKSGAISESQGQSSNQWKAL